MKNFLFDIGNSYIKIFVKNKGNTNKIIIENTKQENLIQEFRTLKIEQDDIIIISSVVNISEKILINYLNLIKHYKYYYLKFEDYNKFLNFKNINIDNLGADRLVDIIGWKSKKKIIFDLGTALTLDVIDEDQYITGIIYPGMDILKDSLSKKVNFSFNKFKFYKPEENLEFLTTTSQINASFIYGIIGIVNQCLFNLSRELNINEFDIVLTGGGFSYLNEILEGDLKNQLQYKYSLEEDLNLMGLEFILKKVNELSLIKVDS